MFVQHKVIKIFTFSCILILFYDPFSLNFCLGYKIWIKELVWIFLFLFLHLGIKFFQLYLFEKLFLSLDWTFFFYCSTSQIFFLFPHFLLSFGDAWAIHVGLLEAVRSSLDTLFISSVLFSPLFCIGQLIIIFTLFFFSLRCLICC